MPLKIHGAFEIGVDRIGDNRGFFSRVFCVKEFAERDLITHWAQANISYTRTRGTIRGLHFQRPPSAEVKMIRALRGQVWDVVVDLREDSPTFAQSCGLKLCAQEMNAIYIPTGCAHGFQTLTDDVELFYSHSHCYVPEHEGGVDPRDPELGLDWPLPITHISLRDQALPRLAECVPIR